MLKKSCLILLTGLLAMSLPCTVSAQSKSKQKKLKSNGEAPASTRYENFPSSKNPGSSQSSYKSSRRSLKKGSSKNNLMQQLDRKVEEYHQRVKEVQKRNEKYAKLSKKPQYSDPSYFGHKRKPKKRPPGKKKFCKECGIIH